MSVWRRLLGWGGLALFPVTLIYYELVFRFSTVRGLPFPGTVYLLLFSLCYAGVGYLLAALPKNRKVAFGLTLGWMVVTALPFLIEYFVYLQFKIFYDVTTCLNGAGGVLKDFTKEIFQLIFSWKGLSHIFLFLLPAGLFAAFGRQCVTHLSWRRWVGTAAAMLAVYLAASFGLSRTESLRLLCGEEYNYQTVVSELGLMTGLRMDVGRAVTPEEPEEFELVTAIPTVAVTEP